MGAKRKSSGNWLHQVCPEKGCQNEVELHKPTQPTHPFYGHYTGQPVLAGTSS